MHFHKFLNKGQRNGLLDILTRGYTFWQGPKLRQNRWTTWHLKMKATQSLEIPVISHWMIQYFILKDWNPQLMPTQFLKFGHIIRVTPYLWHKNSTKSGPNNTLNEEFTVPHLIYYRLQFNFSMNARYKILTEVLLKIQVFCDMMSVKW